MKSDCLRYFSIGTVQNALCTEKIFVLLKTLLAKKSSLKLKTLSCYLLICLIRNNGGLNYHLYGMTKLIMLFRIDDIDLDIICDALNRNACEI